MVYSKMFDNIFKKYSSMCYMIEFDSDTECADKSYSCLLCAGSGKLITNIHKIQVLIDKGMVDEGLPNVNVKTQFGNYYKDSRNAYFMQDSNFDLSPNISRVVLNIVNNQICDIFSIEYLEPIIAQNKVVYYKSSLAAVDVHSKDQIATYEEVIKAVK